MGFRVKSDLRNHQAIVQPRLYDSLMVTQITLVLGSSTVLRCRSTTLELPEASRGFFSGVLKPDWRFNQRSFRLAGPGAESAVRFSRPRSAG